MSRMDWGGGADWKQLGLLKIRPAGLEGETVPSAKEETPQAAGTAEEGAVPHVKTMDPESAWPAAHR